jgi:UDP-glucose 4-epimerase
MDLSGATALVTGARGFIGTAVARRLRDAGAAVHGVSRRPPPPDGHCARWWQADVTEIGDVRRVLDSARPDVVIHLASVVSGARDLEMVLPSMHANLIAAVNLLVAATERGVGRLLFAGSLEEPQPDGTWPVAASPYAAAKFGAGVYARMCHALYGTPAIWLRLFMVYGPAQPDVRKLVPYVTRSLLRGEAPALSSGSRQIDWIYIDDVADAFLSAAAGPGLEGRTLDIGSGRLVAVREVVEQLAKMIDPTIVPRFGAVPERPNEQVRVADVASTAATLGWRARTSLEDGLRRTVAWYQRHGSAPRDES